MAKHKTSDTVGSRVRKIRDHAGLSQGALADCLGTDKTSISRWERGDKGPGPMYRQRMAEWWGCSLESMSTYLLSGGRIPRRSDVEEPPLCEPGKGPNVEDGTWQLFSAIVSDAGRDPDAELNMLMRWWIGVESPARRK